MNCQEYDVHIDDYVDDALDETLRASCESHLSTCTRCRALTIDLQTIRQATRALEPQVPSPQVWYRLAAAVEAEPRGLATLWAGGWRHAVAGGAMCVVLVGSLSWVGARLAPIARDQGRLVSTVAAVEPAAIDDVEFTRVEQQYTSAIAGLENIAREERAALDDDTAQVLQANLTVLDGAIGESRAALDREPESTVAQNSLFEALRSKIALLQDAIALINAMRNADAEGTARILTGQNQ